MSGYKTYWSRFQVQHFYAKDSISCQAPGKHDFITIRENAYHGKSKFGANFQKWVQNFLKIPTSIILHN
jgi:hypothetical protein